MDKRKLCIRPAVAEDVPEIKKVYAEARQYMRDNGNDFQWSGTYPEECIDDDLKQKTLYVCENRGAGEIPAICAVFAIITNGDPTYSYIEGKWKNDLPYAAVHRIAAGSASRGKGVMSYCLDRIFNVYGNVRMDTHELNVPMRSFLKKNGFEACGTVYMQDETPRIAFQKTAGLILASKSPRRWELLAKLGIPFVCETSDVDEKVPEGIAIADTAEYLAGIKAEDVFSRHDTGDITVIGSDTIVILDGKIYGKPSSAEHAFNMIRQLSGRTHEVRTGVNVIARRGKDTGRISFTESALVEFYELSDEEINSYIYDPSFVDTSTMSSAHQASKPAGLHGSGTVCIAHQALNPVNIIAGEWADKAGAYGIQGAFAKYIKKIDGDYYNVMGLPLSRLYHELKSRGYL